jgi:glycine/D-amino acid oxidase-like deaminating enzyme
MEKPQRGLFHLCANTLHFFDTIASMRQNNSPWLTQLDPTRETQPLQEDTSTHVCVIGAGIAGIATLYYILTKTDKKVVILERRRIGQGATGHNAGQAVAEFEKPFSEFISTYGVEQSVDAFTSVFGAWDLITQIFEYTKIDMPFHQVVGYNSYSELEQFLVDIETEYLKKTFGLPFYGAVISSESDWFHKLPEKYKPLCETVSQEDLSRELCLSVDSYHAGIRVRKGVMNSALFAEKLAQWCLSNYPDRMSLHENSYVHGIDFSKDKPQVITNEAIVSADEVVLCTNGFEGFYIRDTEGVELDVKFHHLVEGTVGYMTGFVSTDDTSYMANCYYPAGVRKSADPQTADPYFYITKRKFGDEKNPYHLLSIGGPEINLADREIYHREFDVDEHFKKDSISFLDHNFDLSRYEEKFFWHGLMGYTTTGVRLVGREPLEERLMYNLGCNGIGILPSIMGAEKIARHINREPLNPTVFDPRR